MKPRGIFFDLHGTLIVHRDIDASWRAWREEMFRQWSAAGLQMERERFALISADLFDRAVDRNSLYGLSIYEARLCDMALDLGLTPPGRARLAEIAHATISAWHAYNFLDPETTTVLTELKKQCQLAMVSNWDHPSYVHETLAELALTDFFESVIVSGDIGCDKPAPEIFEAALNAVGLSAVEVWHVGDAAADVEGARAAGITPILIDRENKDQASQQFSPPPRTIGALSELLELVNTA